MPAVRERRIQWFMAPRAFPGRRGAVLGLTTLIAGHDFLGPCALLGPQDPDRWPHARNDRSAFHGGEERLPSHLGIDALGLQQTLDIVGLGMVLRIQDLDHGPLRQGYIPFH